MDRAVHAVQAMTRHKDGQRYAKGTQEGKINRKFAATDAKVLHRAKNNLKRRGF